MSVGGCEICLPSKARALKGETPVGAAEFISKQETVTGKDRGRILCETSTLQMIYNKNYGEKKQKNAYKKIATESQRRRQTEKKKQWQITKRGRKWHKNPG